MAVPTDLINLVLKDYYAKKEKQTASISESKPTSSKNADKDGNKLEQSRKDKYEDYKKDSYSYDEEAYEMYPEYYDPYGSYIDPYAPTAYVPPAVGLDPSLGPSSPFVGPPGVDPAIPTNPHRPPLRHPIPNQYGPPPRYPPPNPYGPPLRHPLPSGPPRHFGPRHLPHRRSPPIHPDPYYPPHNTEYKYHDDSERRSEKTRQNVKRRYYEDRSSEYNKRYKVEDFDYITELYDYGKLPRELTNLFTLRTCNLCLVTIAVPGMMELHYRGKGHVKRVKGWMYANKGQHNLSVDEIERIGQHDMVMPDNPLENKAQAKDSEPVEEMDISYCRVCNIPISSAVVAKQHYSGKKHQKALLQSKLHDLHGNYGHVNPAKPLSKEKEGHGRLYCHICKVASTNDEQYEIHLSGKRHKKAWKESQVVVPVGASFTLASHNTFTDGPLDMLLSEEVENEYDVSLYCLRCKEYFPTQPEFTYHSCSNETINTGEFFCKKCKTKFDTRPELKYHDCPEDHYCVECDRYFDTPNDAMKHSCDEQEEDNGKKSMEGENLQSSSFYCTLCKKELNSAIGLEAHGKGKLHRILLFKLKKSQGISIDFNPFRSQARIQFHCEQCDINFKNGEELSDHKKKGKHMIPLTSLEDIDHVMIGSKESQPIEPEQPGAYDIRNVDVKALMKEYYKN